MKSSAVLVICLMFLVVLLLMYTSVEMLLDAQNKEAVALFRQRRDKSKDEYRDKRRGVEENYISDNSTRTDNRKNNGLVPNSKWQKQRVGSKVNGDRNAKEEVVLIKADSKHNDNITDDNARRLRGQPGVNSVIDKEVDDDEGIYNKNNGIISTNKYFQEHVSKRQNVQEDRIHGDYKGEILDGDSDLQYPIFVDSVLANGPGEGGEGVEVNVSQLNPEDKARYDEGWKRNGFNQYVSDMVSVRRSLPHGWSQDCKNVHFRSDLPPASVILIFHNEAWSVLLRAVHSVLSRTPEPLLHEIILVDDFSTFDHLKKPLEQYWRNEPKVKILRAQKREGLIRARLLGYEVAKAPLLVFFDSHIECFPGWYEPLADRIVTNPNITVFPSIEVINDVTLRVFANHNVRTRGIFRWQDLTYDWGKLTEQQEIARNSTADPIESPTMPGGLFAISRDFFTLLGTYDSELDYWGGENIEISFKAWMCHGAVELVPCSHVGHIFRSYNPIKWKTNVGYKNSARVAEVWMDDFKNYFFELALYNLGDYGDVSERRRLREKLGCRSFEWFLKNVAYMEMPPQHVINAGQLTNQDSGLCVDSFGPSSERPKMTSCHGQGGNQFWFITFEGTILQKDRFICLANDTLVLSTDCKDVWNLTESRQLVHKRSRLCLDHDGDLTLTLAHCDPAKAKQVWITTPRRTDLHFPTLIF